MTTFLADNVIFFVSLVLMTGLVAGASVLEKQQGNRGAPQAPAESTITITPVSQTITSSPAGTTDSSNTGTQPTTSKPATATKPATTPAVKPSIRSSEGGGWFDDD